MPAPSLVFFFPGLFTGCSPLLVLSRSCFVAASLLVFFSAPTTLPRNPSCLSLWFIPLRSPFFFFLFPYPLHWYASMTDHFFFFLGWGGGFRAELVPIATVLAPIRSRMLYVGPEHWCNAPLASSNHTSLVET